MPETLDGTAWLDGPVWLEGEELGELLLDELPDGDGG